MQENYKYNPNKNRHAASRQLQKSEEKGKDGARPEPLVERSLFTIGVTLLLCARRRTSYMY